MGVRYTYKENEIIACSNSIFDAIYSSVNNIVEKEKISLSDKLTEVFEKMEMGLFGIGFDLTEHLKTKKDLELFKKILVRAIEKLIQNESSWPETTKTLLKQIIKQINDNLN